MAILFIFVFTRAGRSDCVIGILFFFHVVEYKMYYVTELLYTPCGGLTIKATSSFTHGTFSSVVELAK